MDQSLPGIRNSNPWAEMPGTSVAMGNPGGQEPGNELFAAVCRPISGCCTGPAVARLPFFNVASILVFGPPGYWFTPASLYPLHGAHQRLSRSLVFRFKINVTPEQGVILITSSPESFSALGFR